jgi:hypothetical protein
MKFRDRFNASDKDGEEDEVKETTPDYSVKKELQAMREQIQQLTLLLKASIKENKIENNNTIGDNNSNNVGHNNDSTSNNNNNNNNLEQVY